MPFNAEFVNELKVLTLFKPDTMQEGIKIHSTADAATIEAARRLYSKGLVTRPDGGYLTELGAAAVEHTHALLTILADSRN